jgi:hypothetical protein
LQIQPSWSSDQFGPNQPGAALALVVLQQGNYGDTLAAIDPEHLPNPLPPDGTLSTFKPPSPIPVTAGEVIGLYGVTKESSCYFPGTQSETDIVSYSHFESQPAIGASVPLEGHALYYRVDVSAELSTSGGGNGGNGANPPAPPTIESKGQVSTVRKGPKVEVDTGQQVMCAVGGNACSVEMTLTSAPPVRPPARSNAISSKKPKTVVVGSRDLTLQAGQSTSVAVPLNGKGASLLRKDRRLKITATTRVTPAGGSTVTATKTVTAKQPPVPGGPRR